MAVPWEVVECDAAPALTPVGLVSEVEQAAAAAASAVVVEVATVKGPDQPVGWGPPAWLPWVEVAAVGASEMVVAAALAEEDVLVAEISTADWAAEAMVQGLEAAGLAAAEEVAVAESFAAADWAAVPHLPAHAATLPMAGWPQEGPLSRRQVPHGDARSVPLLHHRLALPPDAAR